MALFQIYGRSFGRAIGCALALFQVASGRAQTPSLISLQPSQGTERWLALVHGAGLNEAAVVWDAGLPSEKKLPQAVHGATMFSIPPKSRIGSHPVLIESSAGRSTPLIFIVKGAAPPALPRLEGVTLASSSFEEGGK